MAATPHAEILVSTFNGAKFLNPFLDSILAQTHGSVSLRLRDDGSTDDSREIVAARIPGAVIDDTSGVNIGPARSFLSLLERADEDADVLLFGDQDDVWMPERVARAVQHIDAVGDDTVPILYCSQACVTDEDLRIVGMIPPADTAPSFGNALIENVAIGCTIAMNQAARRLIASRPPAGHILMHDWWCYLVVAALGKVVFDPHPTLLYRRHPGTYTKFEIGYMQNIFLRLLRGNGFDRLGDIRAQAHLFRETFGDLLAPSQSALVAMIEALGDFRALPALLKSRDIIRRNRLDTFIFRMGAAMSVLRPPEAKR